MLVAIKGNGWRLEYDSETGGRDIFLDEPVITQSMVHEMNVMLEDVLDKLGIPKHDDGKLQKILADAEKAQD